MNGEQPEAFPAFVRIPFTDKAAYTTEQEVFHMCIHESTTKFSTSDQETETPARWVNNKLAGGHELYVHVG